MWLTRSTAICGWLIGTLALSVRLSACDIVEESAGVSGGKIDGGVSDAGIELAQHLERGFGIFLGEPAVGRVHRLAALDRADEHRHVAKRVLHRHQLGDVWGGMARDPFQ